MTKLPVLTWIGNAWAVLLGRHGDVSRQAQAAGCSRQAAYEHAAKVHQAVADAQQPGPSREELLEQLQQLQQENRQLWQALEDTIDFPKAKQQQFAVTAVARGLSNAQVVALLAVLLGARAPSRATVGRWAQQAGQKAGRLLQRLDGLCRPLVGALALDEIFCRRRPTLVAVEPASLACVLAQKAPDCTGETWAEALQPWDRLERVVADAGRGIHKGVQLYARRRPLGPRPPLDVGLDLFHPCRDAATALRQAWGGAERVWRRWDDKQAALGRLRWRGVPWRNPEYHSAEVAASSAKGQAARALAQAERQQAAWHRARGAFELFGPDGRLNDRAQAEAEIEAALPELAGKAWSKVRTFLGDERALSFLDQLHRELEAAEPRAELRPALVQLWRLRRARRRDGTAVAQAAVQQVVCAKLAADWGASYRRVARVLSGVVRASSAVEGMNSVWRMHQDRHRTMTQGLLDLKRLYWNCQVFRQGKRKGQCPYRLLGLRLPTYDPWALLQMDPDELTQEVSTAEVAA